MSARTQRKEAMGRPRSTQPAIPPRKSEGSVEIPNKLFFRIGEVCKLIQLEPYVLRFWETEFPTLSPTKGANGRRMYRKKDVELLFQIKNLLYVRGFTIAGAKKALGDLRRGTTPLHDSKPVQEVLATGSETSRPKVPTETLRELKAQLRDILTILNRRC
ncbi:MAG: MerR family transcriptional regulator [Terriglobia bacterium]